MKSLIVYLVCAASIAGCSRSLPEGDALCLALETSPNRLDPPFVVDVAEGQICSLIYQGLVRFSPQGEVIPDAARSWEIQSSGTRYVFRLDTRARFSDGGRLAARDVVWSFKRVLSPASRSPRKWVLDRIRGAVGFSAGSAASIQGLAAPDDSTVVIELDRPFRPFLDLLAMPAAYIVKQGGGSSPSAPGPIVRPLAAPGSSAESAAASGRAPEPKAAPGSKERSGNEPVGSGRWVLSKWERGDFLELVPNRFYPSGPPPVRRVVFRVIPEAFTRIAEFESGTLDVLRIPQAELDRFLGDPTNKPLIQSQPELRVTYIGLNNRKGPLRDPRVRRAVNMAVDVDRIISVLVGGHAVRATGSVPPGLAGHTQRTAYPYDPARAKRLLEEAGYADGFELEIWQRDSPEGNRVVEAVQGYLLELGIRVRIIKREWNAFKEAVSQGRVDAFFLDWYGDYPDAENFLYPLFHSANLGGGGNRSFFVSPHIDSLIEESQRTLDARWCYELYALTDSLVYDQAPWLYLYFPTSFVIVSERVHGYTFPVMYLGEDLSTVSKDEKGDS